MARGRQGGPDEIDLNCYEWSKQRRVALGIILPEKIEPRERIGQLRCTLGKVRSERDGASQSKPTQHFPEVYTGMGMVIHQAYCLMPGEHRMVMHLHYVWREIAVIDKVPEVPTTPANFWAVVGKIKSYIQGYLGYASAYNNRSNHHVVT